LPLPGTADISVERTTKLSNNGSATKKNAAGRKKNILPSDWLRWSESVENETGKMRSALHAREKRTLQLPSPAGRVSMLLPRDLGILLQVGEQPGMGVGIRLVVALNETVMSGMQVVPQISPVDLGTWVFRMVAEAMGTRENVRSAPTMDLPPAPLLALVVLVLVARGNILSTSRTEGAVRMAALGLNIL
jgi:hypothetical protein